MIIGITGHAQNGKDTAARWLVENRGFTQMAFADGVRDTALAIDPFVSFRLRGGVKPIRLSEVVLQEGWETAKQHDEIRRLLQVIGTEAGRDIHGQDVWVSRMFKRITELTGAPEPALTRAKIVISDVRFPNEERAIHRWNGILWRVERLGFDNGIGTDHASERYVDSLRTDHVFYADSVETLHRLIESQMKRTRS